MKLCCGSKPSAGRSSNPAEAPAHRQLAVVLGRHAEQLPDHLDREGLRDVRDEVELTLLERPVDQVADDLADVGLEVGDPASRERRADDLAIRGVLGRIHVDHHLARNGDRGSCR